MERNPIPKLNKRKLRNVILHFLNKLGSLDKKKLIYLLYNLELDYYEKNEEHLIGLTFIKTKRGIKIK